MALARSFGSRSGDRARRSGTWLFALALACSASAQQSPLVLPPGTNDYHGTGEVLQRPAVRARRACSALAEEAQMATVCSPAGDPSTCSRDEADYPAYTIDQLLMYDGLLRGAPTLTPATLTDYFKDATFGMPAGQDRARVLAGRARGRRGDPRRRLQRAAHLREQPPRCDLRHRLRLRRRPPVLHGHPAPRRARPDVGVPRAEPEQPRDGSRFLSRHRLQRGRAPADGRSARRPLRDRTARSPSRDSRTSPTASTSTSWTRSPTRRITRCPRST